MKNKIVIIDYGVGNILSISRAIQRCGKEFIITADYDKIAEANHIILPGVGAFKFAMEELKKRKLDEAIIFAAKNGSNILGICLGMQLLFDISKEFGTTFGLGLIKGDVVPVPKYDHDNNDLKVPIIGWHEIHLSENNVFLSETILINLLESNYFYFVHSYMCQPNDKSNILAYINFGSYLVPAIIKRDNIYGCQFHPEKSGAKGLKVISNFCNLQNLK